MVEVIEVVNMMVVMLRKCMINDETVTPSTYLFWPDFFSPTTLKSFPRDLFFGCTLQCVCMYVCIPNWPLPIGAFQDQYKQIVINEHK